MVRSVIVRFRMESASWTEGPVDPYAIHSGQASKASLLNLRGLGFSTSRNKLPGPDHWRRRKQRVLPALPCFAPRTKPAAQTPAGITLVTHGEKGNA